MSEPETARPVPAASVILPDASMLMMPLGGEDPRGQSILDVARGQTIVITDGGEPARLLRVADVRKSGHSVTIWTGSGMKPRVIRPRRHIVAPLPAPPPGALGWNVYTSSSGGAAWTFREFIPAPDLDGKLTAMTDGYAAELEAGDEP